MLLGVPVGIVVLVALVLILGATVQSLVGLGLGLVAAPVVTLLEPSLMPVLLLVLGMLLPMATLAREHRDIDWRGLGWSLPLRFPGTWLGVLLLAALSERTLGVAVAVMVLLAIAVTASSAVVPKTRTSLMAAGFASGITGTTSAIGGPPIALVYQSQPPREIRSTLAVYFIVGSALSLAGLALAHQVSRSTIELGLLLTPTLLIGSWLGHALHGRLPEHRMRLAVLAVCSGSAAVLLVRSLG